MAFANSRLPTSDSSCRLALSHRLVPAQEIAGPAEPRLVTETAQSQRAKRAVQVILDRVLAQEAAVADLPDGQPPCSQMDDLPLPLGQLRQRRGERRVVPRGRQRLVAARGRPLTGGEPALMDVNHCHAHGFSPELYVVSRYVDKDEKSLNADS